MTSLSLLFALALPAGAQTSTVTACVYDPGGASGDAFQMAKQYQTAALSWGVTLDLKPYTSESVASNDFRNGQCDLAILTGVRSQTFSKAAYSVEAMGLVPSYSVLKAGIQTLAKEAAAKIMVSGDYEVGGFFPAGSVYLYLRDRNLADVAGLAGKKICTLDFDPSARVMVEHVGGQVVPADVGTFASLFNNGSCEVAYAPATAYGPLELYKGLGDKGGLVKFPIAQLTLQVHLRTSKLPAGFGQQSRTWAAGRFDDVLAVTQKAEAQVDPRYWIEVPADKAAAYTQMLKEVRTGLVGKGNYDPTVVALFEKLGAR